MDHVEFTHTAGLARETVDQRLRAADTGVLALADGDDAYAVPLAFFYSGGDTILFRVGRVADSEKIAYIESTGRACFVVYDYVSEMESWSVLVRGELSEVPPDDPRYDDAKINRRFPDLRVFDEAIDDIEVVLYELEMASITGRATLE